MIFALYAKYNASLKGEREKDEDDQAIFHMLCRKEDEMVEKAFMVLDKKLQIHNLNCIVYAHDEFPCVVICDNGVYGIDEALYIIELRGFRFYITKKPDEPDKRVMKVLNFYLGVSDE